MSIRSVEGRASFASLPRIARADQPVRAEFISEQHVRKSFTRGLEFPAASETFLVRANRCDEPLHAHCERR